MHERVGACAKATLYCKVLSMTILSHPLDGPRDEESRALTRATSRIRIPMLCHAVLLGVAGDVLLRDAGLGFPLWVGLLALSAVVLTRRDERAVRRETAFWLTVALLFALFVAWRASGVLQSMDVLATAGALGLAAVASSDARAALLAYRLRDTVWASATVLKSIAAGFIPLAWRALDVPGVRTHASHRVLPVLRAVLISLVVLTVFGSLLRGADPLFASFVSLPVVDVGEAVSHVIVIGFFAWVVGGWARGALRVDIDAPHAPDVLPIGFGPLDINLALGTLIALFVAYIASQLGWYFGGESFLRERTGLTAATYARHGFFELVWVVALVLPLLMVTRAGLRGDRGLARRHTVLALPLVALVGATTLSAMARMRLYVLFYGLTTDRLFPLVFMGWLAVVLVWFACTVLRNAPRPFVAGALLSGALMLTALNLSNPDVIVARVNLARAERDPARAESAMDLGYLASLSGAAVPLAVRATLTMDAASPNAIDAHRCEAARKLLRKWGSNSAIARRADGVASWRTWNVDEALAMHVVAAHAAALRDVQHRTCARTLR